MTTQAAPADPTAIIGLGTAFCTAKAVLTAIELGLFTALHPGPALTPEICQRLGLDGRGASDFLELLVALGLLERTAGGYRNCAVADRFLVRGEPSYIGGFLERANHNLYPAWGRLTEALRTGEPQAESDFLAMIEDPSKLRRFLGMMDALTSMLGPGLAQAMDWSEYRSVVDVGGARGNLVAHLAKAHPHLEPIVFDLPQMAPFFDEHMSAFGLRDRVSFVPGDFFTDPLPRADVMIIGHVLHDWAPDERRALIDKAAGVLRPGGALLVYDRMLDDPPASRENLVISLDMLLTTKGGAEYPVDECRAFLRKAGLEQVSATPLGDHDTLVVGRKRPGEGRST